MTLFAAFAAVLVPVAALGLAGRSARLSAALVAVALAVIYAAGAEILGRPKPARLALAERLTGDAVLAGSHMVENVGIWLWVLLPGQDAPRAYVLPWSLPLAKELQRERRKAEKDGTAVSINGLFRMEGEVEFHARPQPAMPPKK